MIKILELFSGYGTATFALKRLGIPHEIVGYSDIDKYTNQCFRQNHQRYNNPCSWKVPKGIKPKELGDVKLINPNDLEDFDLLTGGFPCQAFSIAGKGLGELDPRGTLFYELIRIAEVKKPRYMLLENVKGLTCKKFKDTFNKILSELDRIGYKVHWKVLNTKDYGIPQNRERVWFVCFREQEDYDKFTWPEKEELKIFIKDILEQEVDKKYYLSPLLQERFRKYLEDKNRIVNLQPRQGKGIGGKGIISKNDGTTYCVDTACTQGVVDNLVYDNHRKDEIQAMGTGGNNVPMILGYTNPNEPHQSGIVLDKEGISNALYAQQYKAPFKIIHGQLRRLTPKECFRLQGFLNDEINLEGLSDTQCYKLAGNGQSVNVVAKIFERMFK